MTEPGGLQPDQPGARADLCSQIGGVHRVVEPVGDAPGGELALGQRLVRAIRVVRNQDFIAGSEQAQCDRGDGRQAAGRQQALQTAFKRAQPFFEQEGGRRAVQPVGVTGLLFPVPGPHGRDIGKDDGGGLEYARLGRRETCRRRVGMVNEGGDGVDLR